MGNKWGIIFTYIYIYIYNPPGNYLYRIRGVELQKQVHFIQAYPLRLGSTGQGCDSIQGSGCQTQGWGSMFYTKGSLVHVVLGVPILY